MEACKFKKGDKVRIIGNQQAGVHPVGFIGYVGELDKNGCRVETQPDVEFTFLGNWYLYEDLELVDYDWDTSEEEEPCTSEDPRKQLHNTMGVEWSFDKSNSAIIVDGTLTTDNLVDDNVNHPSHYGQGSIEAIDYIKDFLNDDEYQGYLRGNIAKYLHRWPYKNGVEDLRKAEWYLKKLIEFKRQSE